ncbi:unnamed protein product [Orchesella dallaii]|uniref:Uncharacterized protein n=1 Tax=Orchesella dallaii TaxID=48710 RepID=A0ABP1S0Q3_9HEXA
MYLNILNSFHLSIHLLLLQPTISLADDLLVAPIDKLLKKFHKQKVDLNILQTTYSTNPVPTSDLDKVLFPFRKCFTLLTNFQGVDLFPPLTSPIILKQPEFAIHRHGNLQREYTIMMVPKGLKSQHNVSKIFQSSCSMSTLFHNEPLHPCFRLDFMKFVSLSRPLTCQANIALFPQQYVLTNIYFRSRRDTLSFLGFIHPPIFYYPFNLARLIGNPSQRPVNLLVLDEFYNKFSSNELNIFFQYWVISVASKSNIFSYEQKSIAQDTFIVAKSRIFKTKTEGLIVIHNKIVSVIALEITFKGFFINGINLHNFSSKFWQFSYESLIFYLSNLQQKQNQVIYLKRRDLLNGRAFTTEDNLHPPFCKDNPYSFVSQLRPVDRNGRLFKAKTMLALVREAVVNIASLVIFNSTLIIGDERESTKCVDIPIMSNQPSGYDLSVNIKLTSGNGEIALPLQMKDPARTFQFLGCGKPSKESVGYDEFINIFQENVWLITVIFIALVFPLLFSIVEKANQEIRKNGKRYKFNSSIFIQPIVILLEEGEAFTENDLQLSSLKWMLGSLLISGTVISNAYKYDNVYNVIAPKKLIPYRFFHQLVKDKFTTYTLLTADTPDKLWPDLENFVQQSPHQVWGKAWMGVRRGFRRTSFESDVLNVRNLHVLNGYGNKTRALDDFVLENTKLHPNATQVLEKTLVDYREQEGRIGGVRNHPWETFFIRQWVLVANDLRRCKNSAAILPEVFALQMVQGFRKVGKKYAFVGKDPLFTEVFQLELSGWIPFNVWRRVRATETSGVWNWWKKVVGSVSRSVSEEDFRRASELIVGTPTMKGNVVIIFILFLMSCMVSLASFFVELVLGFAGRAIFLWIVALKLK